MNFYSETIDIVNSLTQAKISEVILEKFEEETHFSRDKTELVAQELKRYLAMSVVNNEVKPMMFSSEVDNLWHDFVLFTKEYQEFCTNYAGEFIHHKPFPKKERDSKTEQEIILEYDAFVNLYKQLFHEAPSKEIWHPTKIFGEICCSSG